LDSLGHIERVPKFPDSFSAESGELPDDVRQAFLEVLPHTLLYVRTGAKKPAVCFALADHGDNIPHFLGKPKPELLQYYWEVERPCFHQKMQGLSETLSVFEPSWKIIEREYERLKTRAVA